MRGTRPAPEPREADPRRMVRRALWGAFHAAWSLPALFFLRFGRLDAYAAGVTVAAVALCVLMAVGFQPELCAAFPDPGRFDALFLAHSRRLFPLAR